MKQDTSNIDSITNRFNVLLEPAILEGTIGVEEDKLVTNTLKQPQFYRTAIKDHLERIDKVYTPYTYILFEELYEHTALETNQV